jgi:hypothetical protein
MFPLLIFVRQQRSALISITAQHHGELSQSLSPIALLTAIPFCPRPHPPLLLLRERERITPCFPHHTTITNHFYLGSAGLHDNSSAIPLFFLNTKPQRKEKRKWGKLSQGLFQACHPRLLGVFISEAA